VRSAHEGLTYTALQLSVSQSDDASALVKTSWRQGRGSDADVLRKKLARIQLLQSRLLRYNLLISNGLAHKASSASAYEQLIEKRLASLGEKDVGPHLTLSAVLQRRLLRAEGKIERAARLYSQLEAAILGQLNSIRAMHGFAEMDRAMGRQQQQSRLLAVGELVGVVACMYYLGTLFTDIWTFSLPGTSAPPSWLLRVIAVPLVLVGYLFLRGALNSRRV
jgi:uncharacterized membrane-anchored protein